MIGLKHTTIALLGLLAGVAGVHLAAQWHGVDAVAHPTQWALMPVLAAALLNETTRPRSRLLVLTLAALGLSWLGDTVPRFVADDAGFLVMVGCFLVAQVVYIMAFRPYVDRSILHVGRVLLLPYVAVVAVLVVLCAPGAGNLLVPVLVYGLCLGTMAVLATGVNGMVWAGGTFFLVSDGLIALAAFSERVDVPHSSFWVMLTYVIAQLLIVLGVLEKEQQG